MKGFGHRRLRRDFWKRIAGVHNFVYAEQAFTEASGRMERGEIVMAEVAAFEQRDSQRIADGHGDGRACSRRKV